MKWTGWVVVLGVGLGLAGCAAFGHQPPSCDGAEREPMNAGRWDGVMSWGCGK